MSDLKFDLLPHRSAVIQGHSTELHVLVRAQAPARPESEAPDRMPLNLALVLDRSGSMSGKPLEEAKRSAAYIIDQLDSRDRASLVVYDNSVNVLVPSTPVVDKALFRQAINGIRSGGSTALFDGWRGGAEQALSMARPGYLSRVLLLSDGNANKGLTSLGEISRHVAVAQESGVSTSTYGLGPHFNEELMVEIAKAGGGQSYYGESSEDLLDPFKEEFSLMSALYARQLKLTLKAPVGVTFEVLNDYSRSGESWRLPDLAYEGEAWALVRLVVPAELDFPPNGGDLEVLHGFLSYEDVGSNLTDTRSYTLRLPRIAPDAWTAIALDNRVTARVQEMRVAQLQREVREAGLREDWAAVDRLLGQAEMEAGSNAWVQASLVSLKRYARRRDRERMSKEAFYSSRKMTHRLAERDEDSRRYAQDEEALKASYLRKKGEQGKRLDRPD